MEDMKHLLTLMDLDDQEIVQLLDLADQLKYEKKHGIAHPHLKGKSIGLIFQKASTRTRVSLKPACTSWEDRHCFCPAVTCRLAVGNRCRIQPACCPGIWMAS